MKTKRSALIYTAHLAFYTAISIQTWASSGIIERGFGATLTCPFNVINGSKSIGTVIVACFSDTACTSIVGNYSWGGRGGTPTLQNGSYTLSNDAMANVALTTACVSAQSIQLQVQNPLNTTVSLLCMPATVSSGLFSCTGGPYTLDINNL